MAALLAVGVATVWARPLRADDAGPRDVQAAVDSYLATASGEAGLVGGPGSAGYDAGFWIRGGDFLLRINLTLQARFESADWDDPEPTPGGDLSGYSLPRATVKLSGEAPCRICYYLELEFGHFGRDGINRQLPSNLPDFFILLGSRNFTYFSGAEGVNLGNWDQSLNYDELREAWIEWCACPSFNVRMGQVKTPNTRQLMTPPELQQFADISLASSWTGSGMPGYTDRNRDFGFLFHGSFGCRGEWSWMASVTNGDGADSIRNVLDDRTDDNLAYAARVAWAFLEPIGYEEGALRQMTCTWYGEVGAWVHYFADRRDQPHTVEGDFLSAGADLALGYGGWSLTAAYSIENASDLDDTPSEIDTFAWLVQVGYLFPCTAWEVAARASGYDIEGQDAGFKGDVTEFAFAVNYYVNGHGNKLTVDVAFLDASDDGTGVVDFGPGFGGFLINENSAILLRFQWQLAL
jgi:hypothetical protein